MNLLKQLSVGVALGALCAVAHPASGQEGESPSHDDRPHVDQSSHPRETMSIRGVCRDENQRPLAGVAVGLWKVPRAKPGERIRETKTDAEGRFRFADLPAPAPSGLFAGWSYILAATHAGRESRLRPVPPPPADEVEVFYLHPGGTLAGRVFDHELQPLAGAIVWSRDADEVHPLAGIRSALTDAEGCFTISDVRGDDGVPVRDSLVVQHPDHALQQLYYKHAPGMLNIRLIEGGTIQGRVIDQVTGRPAAGVIVTARGSGSGKRNVAIPRETRTDEEGKFRFTGIGKAVYHLTASAEDRVAGSTEVVTVDPKEVHSVPDLGVVRGGVIEGRVLNLKGEPISRDPQTGSRLSIMDSEGLAPLADVDDEGRFRVRVAPGRNRLQLQLRDLWERTWRREKLEKGLEVAEGQTVPVTFRILDKAPPQPRPERSDRGAIPLPEPVAEERWAAKEIRELGGWYTLDPNGHVVEVNMVYHEGADGTRYDNRYTDSDDALRAARGFSHLKRLFLHGAQATDEAMASVANLKELQMFFVWDAVKLSDAGVRHLGTLENLENVHLGKGGLGDGTLEVLAGLPKLKIMSLQGNCFTDKGLAHLADMEQLESLWIGLGQTQVTDAGLKHLEGLTNLQTLDLQKTGVTAEGVAEMKKAVPGVRIIHR